MEICQRGRNLQVESLHSKEFASSSGYTHSHNMICWAEVPAQLLTSCVTKSLLSYFISLGLISSSTLATVLGFLQDAKEQASISYKSIKCLPFTNT